MMILDGTGLVLVQHGVVAAARVDGSGNPSKQLTFADYQRPDGYLSSRRILAAFQTALQDTIYANSTVGNAEQAVNVRLGSYGMRMDVVPAIHIIPPWGQDYYMIPRGRGSHGWLETNPKLDGRRIADVGGADVSTVRDVVRLLRYWNQEQNRVQNWERLSRYHVEVMTLRALEARGIGRSITGCLVDAFVDLRLRVQWPCPTQTGFGGNADAELGQADRQAFLIALANAEDRAIKAWMAESAGDHALALVYWGQVFGSAFPID